MNRLKLLLGGHCRRKLVALRSTGRTYGRGAEDGQRERGGPANVPEKNRHPWVTSCRCARGFGRGHGSSYVSRNLCDGRRAFTGVFSRGRAEKFSLNRGSKLCDATGQGSRRFAKLSGGSTWRAVNCARVQAGCTDLVKHSARPRPCRDPFTSRFMPLILNGRLVSTRRCLPGTSRSGAVPWITGW